MQVSATLIAAQQAAREARARLQVPTAPQAAAPGFAAALSAVGGPDSFAPLPLKQTAAPQAAAPVQSQTARLGTLLDITV